MDRGELQIAPSILSADFGRLDEEVRCVLDAGADVVHIDVMDGHFVPPITIGPLVVKAVDQTVQGSVPLDCHLMVSRPQDHLASFAEAGADWISIHAEVEPHLHGALQEIRSLGAEPGVVLNPHTPLAVVEEVLDEVHHVLIMTVNPGFSGQRMIVSCLDKVRRLRGILGERSLDAVRIEVDGGVKTDNVARVREAGADIVVAGSAVYDGVDPAGNVRRLREAARQGERD